ncbi:MnhB domain-containing protein [Nocardioides terrisoli]|uniref:MnhB domain-containing protein n=1 Tax=Nocardioides terrisoli TaxID=3388267 RepID=UPI00287B9A99|nr:MnhB domain-containing protein [Nocardioides marmorisolisilvae]
MNRRARLVLFLLGGAGVAVMFVAAVVAIPPFGHSSHPNRDLAVPAATARQAANVISSVNFDQRAMDTLGEETILIASVVGAVVLLRPGDDETERHVPDTGRTLQGTRLLGYLLLPVTLVVGLDVVWHGHLTPGGGFQGGVVLATGLHLLYITGDYSALERLRPVTAFDVSEAFGAAVFAATGLAGMAISGSFLANFIALGKLGQLMSSGTVPLLNAAVGLEVFGSMVVLLAGFFEQDVTVTPSASGVRR